MPSGATTRQQKGFIEAAGALALFGQQASSGSQPRLMNCTQHTQLQGELSRHREDLEELVKARTAELQKINAQLRRELAAYKHIEEISRQEGLKLPEALDVLEKWLITNALEQHHWHRGKTAANLGIPRRSLQRKMNKYGLM